MIALLWIAAAAWAGIACEIWQPVGGTAGHANALEAVRTNATTYSAAEFSKRRLYGNHYMAMDMHVVANVANVPSWCDRGTERLQGQMYGQPLHLTATNLGLRVPLLTKGPLNSEATAFYASSVTSSTMEHPLAASWVALVNLQISAYAPLFGRSSTGRGISRYTIDWIGGATLRSDVVSVQAGYTGTRGLYLDVTQERSALFFNTILHGKLRLQDAAYLLGGVNRLDPLRWGLKGADKLGMTSLFYRELPTAGATEPQAAPEPQEAEPSGPRTRGGPVARLRTGHIRQEDVLGRFDVRFAWHFGDGPFLREAAVATHSSSWHARHEVRRDETISWSVRAGVVHLPDQLVLGVRGGIRPTLRADYLHQAPGSDVWGLRLSARMNDPDILDLYPFAYNALGMNLELTYFGQDF